ncbi:MAG: mutY [Alphaproteobacteria bacterium]|nr:mutY [Alphaproteobacteria bacterium]
MAKTSKIGPGPDVLLDWYRQNGRALPWRINSGRAPSPYHTWLSEIMLQQTGVATVIAYYQRFITRWPNVEALAQASEDEVLGEWAGLGYYSRARNLLKCARRVADDHKGIFPADLAALKALPGIGEYTANAIRAIAFDLPANVVDGNVERVMARVFAYDQPVNLPAGKKEIQAIAGRIAPDEYSGDYAQALMDLGATICTPRKPQCPLCPWRDACRAYALSLTETIPVMRKRPKLPLRHAAVFVLRDEAGRYLLRQRPASGLLGGMWEFPSSPWDKKGDKKGDKNNLAGGFAEDQAAYAPVPISSLYKLPRKLVHVFTHFRLDLDIYVNLPSLPTEISAKGSWFYPAALPALPTLSKKVLNEARKILGDTP